jgi:cell division protein FtsQ
MKGKRIIIRILTIIAWLAAGTGMVALLAAANRNQEKHVCREVLVLIKGSSEEQYVNKSDVMRIMLQRDPLISRPVSSINLSALEKGLKSHQWIEKAELYFDSRNALHVIVSERTPVARIFTSTGSSFYLDSNAHKMPLLEGVSIRLPVITNFTAAKQWNAGDSVFASKLVRLIQLINAEPFWSAQVAQVVITPERKIEILPVVGNHVLKLGEVDQPEKKLKNLFLFYSQVIHKTGLDKYREISAEYEGQVIGVLKGEGSAVDSAQLKKNIEALMNLSQLTWTDTTRTVVPAQIQQLNL